GLGVVQCTEVVQVSKFRPWDIQGSRARAGGHDQLVEPELVTRAQNEPLALRVQSRDFTSQLYLDSMLAVEVFGINPDGVFAIFAGQKALRQRRTLIRNRSVRGQDGQFPRLQSKFNQLFSCVTRDHSPAGNYKPGIVHASSA